MMWTENSPHDLSAHFPVESLHVVVLEAIANPLASKATGIIALNELLARLKRYEEQQAAVDEVQRQLGTERQ